MPKTKLISEIDGMKLVFTNKGTMITKEQLAEIKIRLKHTPYENLKYEDKMLYRLGFKIGYKIGLEHNVKVNKKNAPYRTRKKYNTISPNKEVNKEAVKKIIDSVINHFGITEQQFFSEAKFRSLVMCRSICTNLIRERFNYSTPLIAEILNKKDHTTILYHLRMKHLKINMWDSSKRIWEDYKQLNTNELPSYV